MDALATFGALAAGEGANAMAILAPHELPPGHVNWTAKEITTADHLFASTPPASLLTAWLTTGACLVAWKEATFDSTGNQTKKTDKTEEPSS